MNFCDDVDLLSFEPNLFKDAAWASQMLATGGGDLSGTTLTFISGSLANTPVRARNVVVLTGSVNGSYPLVSRISNTQLTISTLYDDLLPADSVALPSAVGNATGLAIAIRTFSPQIQIISGVLAQACGIVPGTHDEQDIAIMNAAALRRPCALGVLQMIFGVLAAASSNPGPLETRAGFYERAFRRSMGSVKAELDTNGDGVGDVVRNLSVMEFTRA